MQATPKFCSLSYCDRQHAARGLLLWVKPQLAGQRVNDLVSFVVTAYPDLVLKKIQEASVANNVNC